MASWNRRAGRRRTRIERLRPPPGKLSREVELFLVLPPHYTHPLHPEHARTRERPTIEQPNRFGRIVGKAWRALAVSHSRLRFTSETANRGASGERLEPDPSPLQSEVPQSPVARGFYSPHGEGST